MSFVGINKGDNFYSKKDVWEKIINYIPKDKIIYEPFYGDGKSGEHLKELGCKNVIHQDVDFFNNDFEYDLIVTNPPFSIRRKILTKLKEIDKPFIVLLPSSIINAVWFRNYFKESLQVIIPDKLNFEHADKNEKFNFNWGIYYYCYKMNLPKDLIFLS